MLDRLLADVTPLRRSPSFRRLWAGAAVSGFGNQLTNFAIALQVYRLTGSSAAVGLVGLAGAVPGIVVGLAAGPLIDSVDRRRLVLVTSTLLTLVSTALAAQAFAGSRHLWPLYVLEAAGSGIAAVNGPARRTFVPRLLPPDQVVAANALTMLAMHASLVLGPGVAGVITAAGGLRLCFLIDAVSFAGSLYATVRLPAMCPDRDGDGARRGPRAVWEGLRFLRGRPVVAGALLSDLNAMVLAMPVALFPAIAAERFDGSPRALGLLGTALGVGGVLGAVLSGPVTRARRPGRTMLGCVAAWGAALAGFGLVDGLAASLVLLAVAGVADVSSVVLRGSIVQLGTPDAYRGRVSAAEYAVGAAAPGLGNARAGAVAAATGPGASAVIGGVACIAGAALIAARLPALRRYRVPAAGDGAADEAAVSAPS